MAKITLRNTKDAIFKAYQVAIQQNKQLENSLKAKDKEINQLHKSAQTSSSSASPKTKIVEKIVKVSNNKIERSDDIIANLELIQENLGKVMSANSSEQMLAAEKIEAYQKELEEYQNQILNLYEIDSNQDNVLNNLFEEYIKIQEEFEDSFKARREETREELQELQQKWDKEIDEYELKTLDRNEEANKQHIRDLEKYNYELAQERNLEDDEYNQKKKQLKEELENLKQEKLKVWELKEKEVADREAEYKEYKEKHDALESKKDKEIKKAEAVAKGIIDKEYKVKMTLYKTEVQSEQKATKLKIDNLKALIDQQENSIAKLSSQLDQAHKQAQNLAIKALEGATNTESFKAIREIAMEQAKNTGKGK